MLRCAVAADSRTARLDGLSTLVIALSTLLSATRPLQVHQQNMMQDTVRTGAYHTAIVSNASDFAGKTVMDVGESTAVKRCPH